MTSVRSVVRAAVYAPTGVADGRRVAFADEDPFTMGATAVERLLPGDEALTGPVRIDLLGEFPAVAEWGFAAVLGTSVDLTRHPGTAAALARVVRSAEEDGEGAAIVVAADLPERAPSGESPEPSPLGAAAVAFLLAPSSAPGHFPLGKGSASRSAVAGAMLVAERHEDGGSGVANQFVGDWNEVPANGPSVDREAIRNAAARETTAVSEGAYVPRARYLENLPSRWRFAADRCAACGQLTFPARGSCGRCGRRDALTAVLLPRDGGRVLAVTTIRKGGQPTEFDAQVEASGPYEVALVELAAGARVTLQLTDAITGSVRVGDAVGTRLRRLYPMEGEWRYGRKAVPVLREPG